MRSTATDVSDRLPPGHLVVNIARTDLVFRTLFFEAGSPAGREVLAAGEIGPVEEVVLLQWLPNGDFEEIRSEERIQATEGERPHLIGMRCPCGCSKRLEMIASSDITPHWKVSVVAWGRATLDPSVHVQVGCSSQFWLRKGRVRWC